MSSYWGYGNCARIPTLNTYAEAKEHFEKTIPIRGRSKETKPLGKNRRFTWYRITENTIANQFEGTEYKTYACNLYETDCVEFFPDGRIAIRTSHWRTPTTMAFINYVCRDFGYIVSFSGTWHWYVRETQEYYLIDANEIMLKANAGGIVEPMVKKEQYITRISRKGINALRRKYSNLITYGRTVLGMDATIDKPTDAMLEKYVSGGRFTPVNWGGTRGVELNQKTEQNRLRIFKAVDEFSELGNAEVLYEAFVCLAYTAGYYSYRLDKVVCTPKEFATFVDRLIMYTFPEQVFKKEAVPLGRGFHDKYLKYVTN